MIIYGIRYYFSTDRVVRNAVCSICNRTATLTSYTGTKCIHIYFIPIIPLGRNRITDECSACRRHYVMNVKKWESARQLGISGSLEKFRLNPTPEAAVAVHNEMLSFREMDRATEFRLEAEQRFPNNAILLATFGEALEKIQGPYQAHPYYQKALHLRPDLPLARTGMARLMLATDQLDQARELLSFMTVPGAAQIYDISAIEKLAYAYQRAGRHRDALGMFQVLIEQVPEIGKMPNYQKGVKTSQAAVEKAGGGAPIINLPAPKQLTLWERMRPRGKAQSLIVIVVVIIVVSVIVGSFRLYDVSYHRRLYLVNAYDKPATVSINDQFLTVQPNVPLLVYLPEGKKTIQVTSPVKLSYQVDLTYGSIWERLADAQETIFNIGGEAIIEMDRVHYTPIDQPDRKIPTEFQFFTGTAFPIFTGIDYPFTPPPKEVDLDSHENEKIKMVLTLISQNDYLYYLQDQNQRSTMLDFLEARLLTHPDNTELIGWYVNSSDDEHRMKAFLSDHLPFNPVSVPWHRQYQDHASMAERNTLRARYDQDLLKHPQDSDLLYLRSRLAYDINETKDLLARALASNPANPWALHSLAYVRRTKADWSGSEELERKAFNTTQNDDFQQSLQYDLIAENKTKDLEVELLDKLKSQPMNVTLNENLMQCYSKEGNFSAVLDTQKRAVEALQKIPDKDLATKPLLINSLNVSADYYTHNFAQLEQDTISSEQPWVHFLALVGEKKWDAIRANPIPDLDTYSALLASTAARADGQIDLAESLFTNCLNALKAKGDEQKLLLSVLQSPTPPSQADLDNINQDCQVKEVILTTLAYLHPEAKQDFCAAAHQFHVVPTIGYYIVDPLLK